MVPTLLKVSVKMTYFVAIASSNIYYPGRGGRMSSKNESESSSNGTFTA